MTPAMTAPPSTERDENSNDYRPLTVSREFRDKVRVAKAEAGQSYEEYLKQHLPLD